MESDTLQTRKKPKIKYLLIIVLVLIVLILAGIFLYLQKASANPFPADIRKGVSYRLIYPTRLPNGFHVDSESFSKSQGIISFKIVRGTSNIFVTEQLKPTDFNFEDFHLKQIDGAHTVLALAGKAVVGTVQTNKRVLASVISLVTPDNWVFVTTNDHIDSKTLDQLAESFNRVD